MSDSGKQIVVNANMSETRIAVIESGQTVEIYVERSSNLSLLGRIYKAKVSRVLPGMQSAFINIGTDRAAFLYGGDVLDPEFVKSEELRRQELKKQGLPEDADVRRIMNKKPIESLIKAGDEIFVQVAKDPLGSKGPRVTMLVTIPGRYLVLMPDMDSIGISRRIENDEDRDRIKALIGSIKPKGVGLIVRTAAQEVEKEVLEKDLEYLLEEWEKTKKASQGVNAPKLLYQEPDIIVKTVRDLYSEDVEAIIVDCAKSYSHLKHFLQDSIPGSVEKLKLYEDSLPIFDCFGIELDIAGALNRKVWLPSGGYLVIDQTEALTSFDVNSGKYVGSKSVRETVLKTNLEAAASVAVQLRKRNIGGIIIIDFIDMDNHDDREHLNEVFLKALEPDKSKTNVLLMNELGLVQMTRKRTAESLERVLTISCPSCDGRGRVASKVTAAFDMFREIKRRVHKAHTSSVQIQISRALYDHVNEEESQLLAEVTRNHSIEVEFDIIEEPSNRLGINGYDIID